MALLKSVRIGIKRRRFKQSRDGEDVLGDPRSSSVAFQRVSYLYDRGKLFEIYSPKYVVTMHPLRTKGSREPAERI